MPVLTRRRDPNRADCWHVFFGDVRVGTISRCVGNPNAVERWRWSCGFYPGSEPGEHRHGTAPSFETARAAFERRPGASICPRRSEADFQAWRDH